MHLIGGRQTGWDAVRGSFDQVAQLASWGHGELRGQGSRRAEADSSSLFSATSSAGMTAQPVMP